MPRRLPALGRPAAALGSGRSHRCPRYVDPVPLSTIVYTSVFVLKVPV